MAIADLNFHAHTLRSQGLVGIKACSDLEVKRPPEDCRTSTDTKAGGVNDRRPRAREPGDGQRPPDPLLRPATDLRHQ
jgi:hypothetical protein